MATWKGSWRWLVACGAVFVPSGLLAGLTLPHQFAAGTPISASAMNENFEALKEHLEGLEARLEGALATPRGRLSWARVTCQTSNTTPAGCTVQTSHDPFGELTAERLEVGVFQIHLPQRQPTRGGSAVHVTPVTSTGRQLFCSAEMEDSEEERYLVVRCHEARDGVIAPANCVFNVLVID